MYLLIVFLPLLGSSVAGFFGRFLGSEGTAIMLTSRALGLFAFLLLGLIFLFHRSSFHLKNKWKGRLVVAIYVFFFLSISILCCLIRVYLLSRFGLEFPLLSFVIFGAGGGGETASSSSPYPRLELDRSGNELTIIVNTGDFPGQASSSEIPNSTSIKKKYMGKILISSRVSMKK